MALIKLLVVFSLTVAFSAASSADEFGRITGLVAAVYSPFHAENMTLNIDPKQVDAQAKYLNETGVGVAFVCGTTGESVGLLFCQPTGVSAQ